MNVAETCQEERVLEAVNKICRLIERTLPACPAEEGEKHKQEAHLNWRSGKKELLEARTRGKSKPEAKHSLRKRKISRIYSNIQGNP